MHTTQKLRITGRANLLLNAMKETQNWMSRAQLAHATGKRNLSPHDIMLLDRLIEYGIIEKRERESNTPVGIAFDYRLKAV
jgi:hypothetical protein